jgi:hypothetical protein
MEAICSCETSVDFQRNARRYIPEDITLPMAPCLQAHIRLYVLMIRPNDNFSFSLSNKINFLCNENRSLDD